MLEKQLNYSQKDVYTRLVVKNSVFRLPPNDEAPLIMIGTGTGVAPYIAFFEEKMITKESMSLNNFKNSILFFGSKNSTKDYIFKEDIATFKVNGLLSEVITAFSRDQVIFKVTNK